VATDSSGNVVISGYTGGNLSGTNKGNGDAFVAKYSPAGALLWKKQPGSTNTDYSNGVATDSSGNVVISGYTNGDFGGPNQGLYDAWVAKYSPAGALLWEKQLGTTSTDLSNGVATNSSGNVLISGRTGGNLGFLDKGGEDAFVAAYGPNGTLLWVRQVGTDQDDVSCGVAVDGSGNVFLSGSIETPYCF
ncbi:MAG: SBBP repeat-containing protein, partial [Thermosynechococcaceae cyanobacterium]